MLVNSEVNNCRSPTVLFACLPDSLTPVVVVVGSIWTADLVSVVHGSVFQLFEDIVLGGIVRR